MSLFNEILYVYMMFSLFTYSWLEGNSLAGVNRDLKGVWNQHHTFIGAKLKAIDPPHSQQLAEISVAHEQNWEARLWKLRNRDKNTVSTYSKKKSYNLHEIKPVLLRDYIKNVYQICQY